MTVNVLLMHAHNIVERPSFSYRSMIVLRGTPYLLSSLAEMTRDTFVCFPYPISKMLPHMSTQGTRERILHTKISFNQKLLYLCLSCHKINKHTCKRAQLNQTEVNED